MSTVKKRIYELIYLLHRDVTEDETTKLQARISTIIGDFNGSALKEESWGKRRLAYEIKKGVNTYQKAVYMYVVYQTEPGAIEEVERILRLSDACIRFMHIRLDDFDPTSSSALGVTAEPETTEESAQ